MFAADIQLMFHRIYTQVYIANENKDFLTSVVPMATFHNHLKNIAWCFNCSERSLHRVIRISRFLQTTEDNSSDFSSAELETVKRSFQNNDYLQLVDSETEARDSESESILLRHRGFGQRSINCPVVLSDLSVTSCADA